MDCRIGCAACCLVITISSPIPGFPDGKPAGEACHALRPDGSCSIWNTPDYPPVCRDFRATEEYCGATDADARRLLAALEKATAAG